MRRALPLALSALIASPASSIALTNAHFIKCSPQVATSTNPVHGLYLVGNLANGDIAAQMSAALTKPYVTGVLIKAQWATLEPSQGTFNWAPLDTAIAEVKAAGKKYILGIYGSGLSTDTPAWAYSTGMGYYTTLDYKTDPQCGQTLLLPNPWDTTYQSIYGTMIAAAGVRYNADPSMTAVTVEAFNTNTAEVGWNTTNSGTQITCPGGVVINVPDLNAQAQAAGYTATLAHSGFVAAMNAYNAAFPGKELILMVLGGNGMPGVDYTGALNVNPPYTDLQITDFIPTGQAVAGTRFATQFNGFKLNFAGTASAVIGMNAVLASQAAGYPSGVQNGNTVTPGASDYPGGPTQSPPCQMSQGTTCLGWAVLQGMQNYVLSNNIDYLEVTGQSTDILTWDQAVTDAQWQTYGIAQCIRTGASSK